MNNQINFENCQNSSIVCCKKPFAIFCPLLFNIGNYIKFTIISDAKMNRDFLKRRNRRYYPPYSLSF